MNVDLLLVKCSCSTRFLFGWNFIFEGSKMQIFELEWLVKISNISILFSFFRCQCYLCVFQIFCIAVNISRPRKKNIRCSTSSSREHTEICSLFFLTNNGNSIGCQFYVNKHCAWIKRTVAGEWKVYSVLVVTIYWSERDLRVWDCYKGKISKRLIYV